MSALKEITYWKKREDRPPEVEPMAEFFSENGWTLCEEWFDPWYDEEEDKEYEGRWIYSLVYEQKFGEQLHMWHMSPVPVAPFPEIWVNSLKLAQMGWEHYCEENGLA